MSTAVPTWVQYLQALATPAIALLALILGYIQWRTAHQRVVLDLFERRVSVYAEVRSVVSKIMQEGRSTTQDYIAYLRATDGATFLFGSEVQDFLNDTGRRIQALRRLERKIEKGPDEERKAAIENELKILEELTNFFVSFEKLLHPYMRMHQKLPPL